jgi:hypothetical protein
MTGDAYQGNVDEEWMHNEWRTKWSVGIDGVDCAICIGIFPVNGRTRD